MSAQDMAADDATLFVSDNLSQSLGCFLCQSLTIRAVHALIGLAGQAVFLAGVVCNANRSQFG